MSKQLMSDMVVSIPTEAEKRTVMQIVAGASTSTEDCLELLKMLGLVAYKPASGTLPEDAGKQYCPQGHIRTKENTKYRNNGAGKICLQCDRERRRRNRQKKKQQQEQA